MTYTKMQQDLLQPLSTPLATFILSHGCAPTVSHSQPRLFHNDLVCSVLVSTHCHSPFSLSPILLQSLSRTLFVHLMLQSMMMIIFFLRMSCSPGYSNVRVGNARTIQTCTCWHFLLIPCRAQISAPTSSAASIH